MEGMSKKIAATSYQFRFLIGPDKREYTIHSYIVAQQSAALSTTVYGEFKEAKDGFVTWDDTDESTFLSFWHYVNTGNYDDPEPISKVEVDADDPSNDSIQATSAKEPELEPQPKQIDFEWDWGHPSQKNAKRQSKRDMLWNDFQKSWRKDMSRYTENTTCNSGTGSTAHADILIHHCRVYILADRYDIPRLMDLSFNKLHQNLVEYNLSKQKPKDIVELLQFCYAEVVPEKLRQLVVHYAACNAEILWKSKEFQDLLEDYSNLGTAFIGSLLLRLD
ncbi:hypothetical protein ACKVV7_011442 [Pyricularia oryzae]